MRGGCGGRGSDEDDKATSGHNNHTIAVQSMLILRVERGARRGVGDENTIIAQTYAEQRFCWCVEAVMVSLL